LPSNTSRNDRLLERATFLGKRQSLWEKSGNEFSGYASLIPGCSTLTGYYTTPFQLIFATMPQINTQIVYAFMTTIILGNEIIQTPSAGLRVNSLGEKTSNAIALCFPVGLARDGLCWQRPSRAGNQTMLKALDTQACLIFDCITDCNDEQTRA
jgi:hypothetical protein